MSKRRTPSKIATHAGITFANRARKEVGLDLKKPPVNLVPMSEAEKQLAIENFIKNK